MSGHTRQSVVTAWRTHTRPVWHACKITLLVLVVESRYKKSPQPHGPLFCRGRSVSSVNEMASSSSTNTPDQEELPLTLNMLPLDLINLLIQTLLEDAQEAQDKAQSCVPAPRSLELAALGGLRAISRLGGCSSIFRDAVRRFVTAGGELLRWRDHLMPRGGRSAAASTTSLEELALCQALVLLRQALDVSRLGRILRRHSRASATIEVHHGDRNVLGVIARTQSRQLACGMRAHLAECGIDVTTRCKFYAWGNQIRASLPPDETSEAHAFMGAEVYLTMRSSGESMDAAKELEFPPRPAYYFAEGIARPSPEEALPATAQQLVRAARAAMKVPARY